MNHDTDGIDHREYEDLLASAAVGALRPDEHAALAAHLRTCASCREMFGRLLSAADALPFTVQEQTPSMAVRERLFAQVTSASATGGQATSTLPSAHPADVDPDGDTPVPLRLQPVRDAPDTISEGRRRRSGMLWAMAIAATLLLGLAGGIAIDRFVIDSNTDSAQEIALESPTGLEIDSARLEYLDAAGVVRFAGPDLPQPPEGQVYQVWLIAGDDSPPTPVGTIDPATGEFATTADLERYAVFAVTVEPAPLGSAEPTTDPVIVAELPEPTTG